MGLDNGIIALSKDKIDIPCELDIECFWSEYAKAYRYDITYWRKYWNVRKDIYEILDSENLNPDNRDNGDYFLDLNSLKKIYNRLVWRYKKENWKEESPFECAYWAWEDAKEYFEPMKKNLEWLIKAFEQNEDDADFQVYFYDSW